MERPSTRAVIIAQRRSGSTMLCYALSNHPQVHCTRGEPMHRLNTWRWAFGGAGTPWGSKVYRQIIGLALNQWGYRACVAKVDWLQGTEEVWDWLVGLDPPIKAIYLSRENHLRQAVSEVIRRRTRWTADPRVHTHKRLAMTRIRVEPRDLLDLMDRLAIEAELARGVIESRGIPYISLTYRDMVRAEGKEVGDLPVKVSRDLCDWLSVSRRTLAAYPLRRVNPYPLSEIIENWGEVEEVVKASQWAWCLEDEVGWKWGQGEWRVDDEARWDQGGLRDAKEFLAKRYPELY